ncbi:MAG: outer membrane beta-barrel protein [Terracidiphilus sp.]
MKRFVLTLFCLLLAGGAQAVRGQVVPSATGRAVSLTVGGIGSLFQPDYLGGFKAESTGNSLRYGIDGIGVFADVRFTRWIQLEAEARWLEFNKNAAQSEAATEVGEDTYLAGPRVRLHRFGRFTPYAKGLFGFGRTSLNPALTAQPGFPNGFKGNFGSFAMAFGGGVDYRMTKHISVRLADFELQQWMMNFKVLSTPPRSYSPTPHPYGVSVGVSYRVF